MNSILVAMLVLLLASNVIGTMEDAWKDDNADDG